MNARAVPRTAWTLLLLSTLAVAPAAALDSNYWSSAYGTRSQLLGGVVSGSLGDISTVYYNPGAFAFTTNTELLLAGNAYQYRRVSIDNGAGADRALVSSAFTTVPSLLAGEVPMKGKSRLAYAYLTRRSVDIDIERRSSFGEQPMVPIASPVIASSDLELKQDISENWYGISWAHQLSPTLGFGVSPFLVYRGQNTGASFLAQGQNAAGQVGVRNLSREFEYSHWSLLAKLGLIGVRDSLTYGLTLTTPNLGVAGGGTTQYNTLFVDESGTNGTRIGADYREGIEADYRSPLGLGAGASYGWGKTRVHAALDWNAEIPAYTVMETPDFLVSTPSGDSTVRMVISERLSAVLNWGLGLEQRFREGVSGYISYHTDYSGKEADDAPGGSVTRWDLYNVTAGATWRLWRSDLALGLSFASASQEQAPLQPPADGAPPLPPFQVRETLVTMIVGWKISF